MAFTYSPIASVTVGAGGASTIDFTNIPQNYTDLIIKVSARSTTTTEIAFLDFRVNGNIIGNVTNRYLNAGGTSVFSSVLTTVTGFPGFASGAAATANTFGNSEVYIPNYAGSNQKTASADGVSEHNGTATRLSLAASLVPNTTPIASISIRIGDDSNGTYGNFVQHSTATLYGIRALEY